MKNKTVIALATLLICLTTNYLPEMGKGMGKVEQFPPLRDVSADKEMVQAKPVTMIHHSTKGGKCPQFPEEREVVVQHVCPCSDGGYCLCTDSNNCGCIPENKLRWKLLSDGSQAALYKGNTQIGNWCPDEGLFYRWNGGSWVIATCPVKVPTMTVSKSNQVLQSAPAVQQYMIPTQQIQYSQRGYSGYAGFGGSGGSCSSGGCR